MQQPQPRKQSIFKIISLTKNRPIFLYKATEPVFPSTFREEAGKESTGILGIRRAKEEIEKVATRLSMLVNAPKSYMGRRSESCDLAAQSRSKERGEEGIEDESRSRIQKNIRQYLRLAYKRAERDRRSSGPKLPSIPHHYDHNKYQWANTPEQSPPKHPHSDLKDTASMKRAMRRKAFQLSYRHHKEQDSFLRPEIISGWQDYSSPEDF